MKHRNMYTAALMLLLAAGGQALAAPGPNQMMMGPGMGGPGMMGGRSMMGGPAMMAPGNMGNITPEQRQQHREQMRQQGYGPGAMQNMTPEQRQAHWQQMRQQGYGPGAMQVPGTN